VLAVPLTVVPVGVTGLDVDRLRPTWDLLADLEPAHPLGLQVAVVFMKVRRGTWPRREAREVLTELGYPVMDTEIPLVESPYASSFGVFPAEPGPMRTCCGS